MPSVADDKLNAVWMNPHCPKFNGILQRCFTDDNSTYFPPNYASKTFGGYANLIQNIKTSIDSLERDFDNSTKLSYLSEESSNDFWYLYEVLSVEGIASALGLFSAAAANLESQSRYDILIGQLCYGSALFITFFVFLVILRALYNSWVEQTRYHRAALFILPDDILRESALTRRYISGVYKTI